MNEYYENRYSRTIALVLSLVYFINFFVDGRLSNFFELNPFMILEHNEFWRLFTFPLVYTDVSSYLVFLVSFIYFAPRLENLLSKQFFLSIFGVLIVLQGLFSLLAFWGNASAPNGMESISVFVLILSAFLDKDNTFSAFNRLFAGWVPAVIALSAWLIFKVSEFQILGIDNPSFVVFAMLFGLLSSSFLYAKMYYNGKSRYIDETNFALDNYTEPVDPEDLSPALISYNEAKKFNQKNEDEPKHYDYEFQMDEDRLNVILEKINETGQESLTIWELKYLQDYSKNLD